MYIRGKKYNIEVADTPHKKMVGLSGKEKLAEDEGMLFMDVNTITMDQTSIPLKLAFLSPELIVVDIKYGAPYSKTIYHNNASQHVLELHNEAPVDIGDIVEDKEPDEQMHILDDKGNVQMSIEGGERIISIKETKKLIQMAKGANSPKALAKLGLFTIEVLDGQDGRPDEFV